MAIDLRSLWLNVFPKIYSVLATVFMLAFCFYEYNIEEDVVICIGFFETMAITYGVQIALLFSSIIFYFLISIPLTFCGHYIADPDNIGKGFVSFESEEAIEIEKRILKKR